MLDFMIFKPIIKSKNNYIGQQINNSSKIKVQCKESLKINNYYIINGEFQEIEKLFIIKEFFEYKVFIGTISDIKIDKLNSRKSYIKFTTEEGYIYKTYINNSNIEIGKKHIIKGFFDNKNIFQSIFLQPLINLKLEIKNDTNSFKYEKKLDKIVSCMKCHIIDYGDKETLTGKKQKIYVKGNYKDLCLLYKGDEITAYGYYDNKYFVLLSYQKDISNSLKMMDIYLKNILGNILTKGQRERLFDLYGLNTLNMLEDSSKFTQIIKEYKDKYNSDFPKDKKTKDYKLEKIKSCIYTSKYLQEFFFFCEKENISTNVAQYIYNEFNDRAIIELKNNPYQIVFKNLDFFQEADIIAKNFGFDSLNENRISAIILSFLDNDSQKGNVFTFKDFLLDNISSYLNKIGIFEDIEIPLNLIDNCLNSLQKQDYVRIIKDKIYLSYNYKYEKESAKLLTHLLNDFKTPFTLKENIKISIDIFEKSCKLADEQKTAIYNALLNNISILTGGPGTGKTLTVSAIINSIKTIKPNAKIKLCAPTGRASKRMTEVSSFPATTIHKLLHIGVFENISETKAEEIKVEEMEDVDFLIIDEFSMVDIKLLFQILSNLDEKTRLIIVGDYNQLASVGPGQVLKDLIFSKKIPTVELKKIFRQKGTSDIVSLAHNIVSKNKINLNKFVLDIKDKTNILKNSQNLFFINCLSDNLILEYLEEILDVLVSNHITFNNFQILNATNKLSIGSDVVNNIIQKLYNKNLNEDDIITLGNNKKLKKNDKIIQTKNDYNLKVMNGSIGYINDIFYDKIKVEFPDDDCIIDYSYEDLINIQLAYSISIHKSQGSEYPIVIIPFSYIQKNMLNLNLLYTAITRAKSKLILIGNYDLFLESLKLQQNNRNSNLCELLQ